MTDTPKFKRILLKLSGEALMGSDAYGIKVAMTILPIFLAASALLFFAGSFFYERDLNKVEKIALECED